MEVKSERPLPIDGVDKGRVPLDVAGPRLQRPERPVVGGCSTDTDRCSVSYFTNSFQVSVKRSCAGMRWPNGSPVTAVQAAHRRVMTSDTCWKPRLGTGK